MSHERARAFGAIMATMWPLGVSDAETGLINLATKVTAAGDATNVHIDHLTGAIDFVILRGGTRDGVRSRLIAWRSACLVAGSLIPDIELRLDVCLAHLKDLEKQDGEVQDGSDQEGNSRRAR